MSSAVWADTSIFRDYPAATATSTIANIINFFNYRVGRDLSLFKLHMAKSYSI